MECWTLKVGTAVKVCFGLMIQAKEKTIDSTPIVGLQCRFVAEVIHQVPHIVQPIWDIGQEGL